MSIFKRIIDNVKAMSNPARTIMDEAVDSIQNWVKNSSIYLGADSDYNAHDQSLLKGPETKNKSDQVSIIKDTLMIAFISLAAKIAKSDGVVSIEEIRLFDDVLKNDLKMSVEDRKLAAEIFNVAKKNSNGYQEFALQMKSEASHEICYITYSILFKILGVNNVIATQSEKVLVDIGNILEISQLEYDELRKKYFAKELDPFEVLGVTRATPIAEIKKKYKKLALANHPDRLIARGLPENFIKEAQDRLRRINEAWGLIEKQSR